MSRGSAWPVARTAADLPAGRRENFVWHWCRMEGFSLSTEISSIRWRSDHCVSWPNPYAAFPEAPEHALLGNDGLYHLAIGPRLICRHHSTSPAKASRHPEIMAMAKFVDGGAFGVKWKPKPATDAVPTSLLEVPPAQQCLSAKAFWPGALIGSKVSSIRRQLIEAHGGPGCATCSNPWATVIDHDHLTGKIRGYLCRDCNGAVDNCRHLEGCPYAAYLASPPAAHLDLVHPDAGRWLRQEKYVARRACFEVVMSGGISPGFGLQDEERYR